MPASTISTGKPANATGENRALRGSTLAITPGWPVVTASPIRLGVFVPAGAIEPGENTQVAFAGSPVHKKAMVPA